MRFLIVLLVLLLPAAALAEDMRYQLPGAVQRDVKAADGETYRILVAVPDTPPPPDGYPVLYVLDGEDNFPIAVATARRLARARERSGVEPGLVVGIESGGLQRRARDYTPATTAPTVRPGFPGHGLPTGGADRFLDFIEATVRPLVMRDFNGDSRRGAVIGHSFGGVLALHALLTRPQLFSTYVAASPSLWIGDGALVATAETNAVDLGAPRVLLSMADKEDTKTLSRFATALEKCGARVRTRMLSGENHDTTILPAIAEAINAAFGPQ